MIKIMTNIKQLILTLVALLAVTTGAWAADVLNIVVSGTSATIKYDGNSSNNPYLSEIGWEQSGDPWDMYFEIRTNITTVTIDGSCKNFSGTSLNSLFSGFSGLTTINGLENLNTVGVQNMASMFDRCSSLTSLDLSSWNTASVTTMSVMFTGCSKLTSLDLSSWNTENVEMTYSTFSECSELTTVDLSGWNTAKVVNTNYMFGKCPKLENIYVGDGWSTAAVTTSNNMFKGCTKLLSMNTANPATDKTNAHTGDGGYLKVKPAAPACIEVNGPTIVEGKPQWTFEMPAGNVELQVEYWPGMLVKPTNLVGGTLSVEGLGLGTTSFTAPSEWDHNSTKLTSGHFEGFKSVTEEEAKTWPGVPATGKVALFYNYDETEQKWDMIYFKDGAISQNFKGEPQQLATIYNLTDFSFSVFYTTGMQMPAGFEKDDEGNIYVKKDTKFTVIATPAEGYHLVSWSDDATIKELEREFTMTDDDFTVTATFSDEYDLAFEAANANTIEAGKATVKVGDAAATVTEGKLQGVKMGSKVTITAKQGYKFRKVEAKKGGAATLATALENGATVVIAFKYRDDGTCTFTNNNGTFTFVSGTGQLGGGNGPKQLSVENGKLIFKGSGTNSFTDRWSWYGFQVTFDPTANTYEVWKGSYLDVGSFTSISVNGTDITDQLSELK